MAWGDEVGVGAYDLLSWELKDMLTFLAMCNSLCAQASQTDNRIHRNAAKASPRQAVAQNKIIVELIIYLANTFIQNYLQHSAN